jgi:hypothetical protein
MLGVMTRKVIDTRRFACNDGARRRHYKETESQMKRDWFLQVMCLGTVVFGAVMFLLPAATRASFAWLVLGGPAAMDTWPAAARDYVTFLHGVLGAVMVGWGVGLLLALRGAGAWTVVAVSVASWCVPDAVFSMAMGAWPNVALNAAFAVAFALGLWRARSPAPRLRRDELPAARGRS